MMTMAISMSFQSRDGSAESILVLDIGRLIFQSHQCADVWQNRRATSPEDSLGVESQTWILECSTSLGEQAYG